MAVSSARADEPQSMGVQLDLEPITAVPPGTESTWATEVHLHLEPSAGGFLGAEGPGPRIGWGLSLKADFPWVTARMLTVARMVMWVLSLGALGSDAWLERTPVSIQVEVFGTRFSDTTLLNNGWAWGGGLGARAHLYERPPEESVVRNVWCDLNAQLSSRGFGMDSALGLQLSWGGLVSMGPFIKFARVAGVNALFGGLSLDLGAPPGGPAAPPAKE
ncbi:hypothetical protein KRR26_33735 [Corallococcus sp. M34]|uniref:hypothetical protein n=1 Tax=Citreicoccus inhibens TaxID=2849499 RepID=UPI001C24E3CB|nr:hypothetical protein [Citreicoccus inhibens]MBU8900583.1 hypothetical protein [Citreicoccus inhibens]